MREAKFGWRKLRGVKFGRRILGGEYLRGGFWVAKAERWNETWEADFGKGLPTFEPLLMLGGKLQVMNDSL